MKPHDAKRSTKTYLLTCGCSATVNVGSGQAGGTVTCPSCGATLSVPRLGELSRLPPAPTATGVAAGSWTTAHGCILGGSLVALLAGAAAVYLGMAPRPPVDAAMIRAGVAAAANVDVYKAGKILARSGVARPTMPDEERIVQVARSAQAAATVLWGVAALGAAVAIGGGLTVGRGKRGAS